MVYHCLQTEGFPFMIGGVSGVIVDFILYLIYSQCYFWVHDPLNIPQLLFNSTWACANGGEIKICNEE